MDRGNASPKGSDPFETFCHLVTQRWGRGYVDERREGRRESQGGGFGVKVRRVPVIAAITIVLVAAASGAAAPLTTLAFWPISLQAFFPDYVNGIDPGYQRAKPVVRIR